MKYVNILPTDTLRDLTERVGVNNVDQILADNGLVRAPNIGEQWSNKVESIRSDIDKIVNPIRKVSILNQFISNSDIYEEAALAPESTWRVLDSFNSFPDYLYISDQMQTSIPDSYLILGNSVSINNTIRTEVESRILASEDVDPAIFSQVTSIQDLGLVTRQGEDSNANPLNWFKIPLDSVTLYSSLTGTSVNIPAYPEEYSDERVANYAQMPDLLYQYEPWQMYQSSGPRSNTIEFHLHRDMWTGNHLDGKANELIRFCQAQCYPVYNGAAVLSSTVTLYINGSALISGVMTNVGVNWRGPIGQDGWYLEFILALTITEVSTTRLDHVAMLSKGLIG